MAAGQVPKVSRFALLLVLSIALMMIDYRSDLLKPLRYLTSLINIPVETIVNLPMAMSETYAKYYPDKTLYENFKNLQNKQAILEARLQRYETLENENARLATLLSASRHSTQEVSLSEIIESSLQLYSQKIVINQGIESGVYIGQPAIAPEGVLGQVAEIGYLRSVVTLITDPSHGLPVEIQRNGLRTIIHGSGHADQIKVPYLDNQADIQTGDILVSSGLGGRFPVGYKVAIVTAIVKDANAEFLDISAETTAKIGLARQVLLVWNSPQAPPVDACSIGLPPHRTCKNERSGSTGVAR